MEHPFFPTTTTRAESLRWLTIAEKLLSGRDLLGSKSFASRARDADPTLTPADQILAVVDTLLAGDTRIGNNQHDLYAILRLTPQQGRDAEVIASQYRTLGLLLNPQKNKFPFAEQAFRLVLDAWSVLSDPARKSMYDKELAFYLHPQQPDPFGNPMPALHQNFIFFGSSSSAGGVTHPSPPQPPLHFSQVHANPPVDPMAGGMSREPQNFMNFPSSSNIVFGSGSGLGVKPSHETETVNKQEQQTFTFAGNVTTAPMATQVQGNDDNPPGNDEHQPPQPQSPPPQQDEFNFGDKASHNVNVSENAEEKSEDEEDVDRMEEEPEERMDEPAFDDSSSSPFWTACPYCYYMYEYPRIYADCTLRCQNCKKAFQAVIIPSPPPVLDGQESYFCCWGFFPLGFSMENWEKNKGAATSWTPFSPMFTSPQPVNAAGNATKRGAKKSSTPRVYIDDEDEDSIDLSDTSGSSDDDDWSNNKQKTKKKTKHPRGKGASGTPSKNTKKVQEDRGGNNTNVQDGGVEPADITPGESSKTVPAVSARKQPRRVAKNPGKLDLNVECGNEAEEPAPRVNTGNGPSSGEDDNIEGVGFFEGLDDFLSSLPILNVVGDDKVVKAA